MVKGNWVDGQVLTAGQLNADAAQINAGLTDIADHTTTLATHTNTIATHTSSIAANTAAITANTNAIASLQPSIGIAPYSAIVGDGTMNPVTLTHGFGTRGVRVTLIENGGEYQVGILNRVSAPTLDTVVLYHDEVWAENAYTAFVEYLGTTDASPPTTATLAHVSHDTNSVSLHASGSTDNIGVVGYRIYRDGTFIGLTTSGDYTDTGLAGGTAYAYTAKAYDAAGNLSLSFSNTVNTTTSGGSSTTIGTVSTGTSNTTAAQNISASDTISVTAGQQIIAVVEVSHAGFYSHTAYTTKAASSNHEASALTLRASQDIGTSASIHIFDITATFTGTHTVTANFIHPSASAAVLRIVLLTLNNGAARGTPVQEGATAGNTDITNTMAATSVMVVAAGYAQSPTSIAGVTQQRLIGSAASGNGDYLLVATAVSTTSVTFTASNGNIGHSEIMIEYKAS